MQKEDLEVIKLTSKEALLALGDFTAKTFFRNNPIYYEAVNKYLKRRNIDRENFLERIKYLKRKGYIRTFIRGKEKYYEITKKGKEKVKKLSLDNIKIKRPKQWDKKWRIVIFDVPEKMHHSRDLLREKLIALNFVQIQKSVYVFPFECTKEVTTLSKKLSVGKYVLIMISEIIQGEEKIIDEFLDKGVINRKDTQ